MNSVRRLLRSVVTYASANIINSAIPFLLLPVLTRVLSPAEYGAVAMFATVVAVMAVFTGLNVHGAVSVRYFSSDVNHPRFVAACLAVVAVATCCTLVIVFLFSAPLVERLSLSLGWLLAAVLGAAAQAVNNIRLVVWQIQGQAIRYGFFQIAQTLFNLGLSLYLILVLGMGWEGRGLGIFVASFLFAVLGLLSLQYGGRVRWKFDCGYMVAAMRFGVPLIPHALGGIMLSLSDRFIIMLLLGAAATGSYAVGVQVGMVVGVVADAFVKAFGPYLYGELKDGGCVSRLKVARQCVFVFLFFLCVAIIYVLGLPYVYPYLIDEAYAGSLAVAQLVGFGNAFMGMYYVVAGFIFFSEKTGYLSRLTLLVGFFSVGLTYVLVERFGVLGAAWGYVFVQLAFFVGAWILAQRAYPLPWLSLFFVCRGYCEAKNK